MWRSGKPLGIHQTQKKTVSRAEVIAVEGFGIGSSELRPAVLVARTATVGEPMGSVAFAPPATVLSHNGPPISDKLPGESPDNAPFGRTKHESAIAVSPGITSACVIYLASPSLLFGVPQIDILAVAAMDSSAMLTCKVPPRRTNASSLLFRSSLRSDRVYADWSC